MNKSEELAKLLGIKPKIGICKTYKEEPILDIKYCAYWTDGGCGDSRTCTGGYENKWGSIATPCTYYKGKEIYPDFTKPSNFVKLLSIYHIERYPYFNGFFKKNESIQLQLINQMLNFCDKNSFIVDNIKQQAQQTEWDY